MRALRLVVCLLCLGPILRIAVAADAAGPNVLAPPESLVLDNVPPVPADLPERAGRYTEYRTAAFADWHPLRREMLVLTRFGDTPQVHLVKNPGGARTQLTFFPDRVEGAAFDPVHGDYFVLHKGVGGAEFFQNFRCDLETGEVSLLTDGKSRNSSPVFSHRGGRTAYTSTRRNGTDTDLYVQFPLDPKTDRLLAEVKGGGWQVLDWSPDDKKLLVLEYVSINESYLWTFDMANGEKICLSPRDVPADQKVFRGKAKFSPDGRGIYLTTDKGSEFQRLTYFDLATRQESTLSPDVQGDVEDFDVNETGDQLAFTTNENGVSRLHLQVTPTGRRGVGTILPISGALPGNTDPLALPAGVINGLRWSPYDESGKYPESLGFTVTGARAAADVYTLETFPNLLLTRWTQSETGGLNARSFVEPQLVKWTSFDQREISAFLYAPDANRHPGKRPVIINIHGGPEGQYRPGFLGRNNYLINELGCAVIFPNVRGSAGFGKTFLTLDNGVKREDSYRDIGALLDWIKTQPNLDPDRVMLTGGSYGGHMTLAGATLYADRIRCAVDIVGMSNLRTFLERTESYRRDLRRAEYGDERDPATREFMERTAPLNNAAKITKPLFVIQGANDPRVPRNEAEQIVATLKRQNTPVPYLLAKDEGHGFAKKKNADFQFYATVEFIRRYLLGEGERPAVAAP